MYDINANATQGPVTLLAGGTSLASIDGPAGFALDITVSGDPVQVWPVDPAGDQLARATTVNDGQSTTVRALSRVVTLGTRSRLTVEHHPESTSRTAQQERDHVAQFSAQPSAPQRDWATTPEETEREIERIRDELAASLKGSN